MSLSETDRDWNAEERRATERHPIFFDLRVIDLEQDTPLGDVIDISLSGMRIISETPFRVDDTRRVRLAIVLGQGGPQTVCFETHCVWSRYVERLGHYESGCANTLSPAAAAHIAQLIKRIQAMALPSL